MKKRGRKASLTLTIDGRKALLVDWARELDISAKIVRSRIDQGWTAADAVYRPQTREGRAGARRSRAATVHNEPATVSRPQAPLEAPGLRPCVGSVRSYSLAALHLAAGRYDNTHEGGAK